MQADGEGSTGRPRDEELMKSFYGCDCDALARLEKRYRGALFGFINYRFSVSYDEAVDIFQQTWLNVLRTKKRR